MPLFSTKDIFFALVKGMLALWQMWLILGVMALIKLAYILWEKNRLSKSGIAEIDHMDGIKHRFSGKVYCYDHQRK